MKKRTVKQKFYLVRILLFVVLSAAIFISQTNGGQTLRLTYNKQVLAYATNMSLGDLLASANASRAAGGLPPLSLNAKLNNSAQMKANNMISLNYWSHVAPDGTQPWYWFQQSGYAYLNAGENLAYGFNTGSEVNTGWMNSPTHRANIMGDYAEVGFGIASGASYQGDANTVIVAHYGKPQPATPAPIPVPSPAATATPTPTASQPSPTAPVAEPAPIAQEQPAEPSPQSGPTENSQNEDTLVPSSDTQISPIVASEETKTVSVLEQLKNHQTPSIIAASIGLVSLASAGFAATHRVFMKKLIKDGQRFMLRHPLLDVLAVCLTLAMILSTTVGKLL